MSSDPSSTEPAARQPGGAPAAHVLDVLRERGFVKQINDEAALRQRLSEGVVTYYAGFDPTAPSLHVGSLVPLMAMAHLAAAGHRAIAVLGGGTSMVGDPSGKTELRQLISREIIEANTRGIEPQIRRVIEQGMGLAEGTAAGPDRLLLVDNAEWLLPLNYVAFLREVGAHFSVNRMLAAEAYKIRLEKGLSFIEFNYQILQAYDFLTLRRRHGCTLQIGGDDQWGNILAGTDLIRRMDQQEAYALTFPLLLTASGMKMGKTAAGAIWLSSDRTSVFDFYQYFVNVDDRDAAPMLGLLTFLPTDEVRRLSALQGADLREAKTALAFEVTRLIHGQEAAENARAAARAAFGGDGAAANVPTVAVSSGELSAGLKVVDVLARAGLAPSKSAARRLVAQGGVRVGERKVDSVDDAFLPSEVDEKGVLLHAGKKHVRRVIRDD